jgi:hypothetical protein
MAGVSRDQQQQRRNPSPASPQRPAPSCSLPASTLHSQPANTPADIGLFAQPRATNAAASVTDFIREVREAFPTLAHLPDVLLVGQPIDALFRLAREERAAEGKTSKNLEQWAHQNAVKAAASPAEVKAGPFYTRRSSCQARRSHSSSCGMPPAQHGDRMM